MKIFELFPKFIPQIRKKKDSLGGREDGVEELELFDFDEVDEILE